MRNKSISEFLCFANFDKKQFFKFEFESKQNSAVLKSQKLLKNVVVEKMHVCM